MRALHHIPGRACGVAALAFALVTVAPWGPSPARATTVDTPADTLQLYQALAGAGLELVSAAVVKSDGTGAPDQSTRGTFVGAPAALGTTSGTGVVLTTGSATAMHVAGDAGYQSAPFSVDGSATAALPADWAAWNGNELDPAQDSAMLRLVVRPSGPTVSVRYAFASEEFATDPLPGSNDDLGLILADTTATSTSNPVDKNCARVPGVSTPHWMGVRGLRAGPESLRIDETSALTSFAGVSLFQTCTFEVVPGESLTLRFAVMETADSTFDSALILDGGSLMSDAPPTVVLSAAPSTGTTPLGVVFTTTGTTDPQGIVSWALDHGDGTSQAGSGTPPANPSHTYTAAGSFDAVLTVTDTLGQSTTARQTITTSAPPPVEAEPSPSPSGPPVAPVTTSQPPPVGTTPAPTLRAPTVRRPSALTVAALSRGVPLTVGCSVGCTLRAALLLDRVAASKLGISGPRVAGRVTVGTARRVLAVGGSTTLRVKISRAVRAKLARYRGRKLRMVIRVGNAAGTTTVPVSVRIPPR